MYCAILNGFILRFNDKNTKIISVLIILDKEKNALKLFRVAFVNVQKSCTWQPSAH